MMLQKKDLPQSLWCVDRWSKLFSKGNGVQFVDIQSLDFIENEMTAEASNLLNLLTAFVACDIHVSPPKILFLSTYDELGKHHICFVNLRECLTQCGYFVSVISAT